ncbi:MAG: hypothetical protein WAL90_00710 [Desulfobacterales bacterium]
MPDSREPAIADHLKKITLTIEAATPDTEAGTPLQPQCLTFIYGLGTAGLTPFEYSLAGKTTGDVVAISVRANEAALTFGHLHPLVKIPTAAEVHLKVRVEKIEPAGGREIISAMAAAAECGCDCGCGCGSKHGAA